ncbi:ATPase [Desulfosarcina alkanivorans]|uniref:ATPase n=1 Tax=Desulfosarcina alkanivorans TaxID=571177 RepID=A0A5K7YV66_9BACT|nr:ATP-binding protein [Desulfosarcina alkanivorans]BBO70931.1 ATPase [Desulfosarcina alkanivorans]
MKNPFQYGGIVSGPYFADRSQELNTLLREMENNNRVFLVSPRRFGKTCLLHQLTGNLADAGVACAVIDLNAFPDLRSFAGALTVRITRALESNTDRLLKLFSGFQRLRPRLSLDRDGNVSAGLELADGETDALAALVEGLAHAQDLAARKKKRLVVIMDEFSDIARYNGLTVEKAMRSEIQKHDRIGYIFSGSEQSVMLAMVQDSTRAFYKMGRIMKLGPIRRQAYHRFILGWLEKGAYQVAGDDIQRLFDIGEDVPYNIQRLCHAMWESALESKIVDAALINRLPVIIARQDSPHYEMLWQTATQAQKALLFALAGDPEALPFSKDFQMRHGIGPSSSIKASLDSLVKKGILYRTLEGRFRFVDRFMPFWIDDMRDGI